MLQLKLEEQHRSTDGRQVIITDATGSYSVANPGGYGGPNPAVNDVFLALLCWEVAGDGTRLQAVPLPFYDGNSFSTLGQDPGTIALELERDGVFALQVLAIGKTEPLAGSPVGTLFALDNVVYKKTGELADGLALRQVVTTADELMQEPAPLIEADDILYLLQDRLSQRALHRLVLAYLRAKSRERERERTAYASLLLQLQGAQLLFAAARYEEAAATLLQVQAAAGVRLQAGSSAPARCGSDPYDPTTTQDYAGCC